MEKIPTDSLKYFWPMRHYLITCGTEAQPNIIAVSFCMPVSKTPPMVACAIGTTTHSAECIRQAGEFVVNVPVQEMSREIYLCGMCSGRDTDKFRETGWTPMPGRRVSVPIIAECVAHMECRLEQTLPVGDKQLLLATVLAAYADEDVERGQRSADYATGAFPQAIYGDKTS